MEFYRILLQRVITAEVLIPVDEAKSSEEAMEKAQEGLTAREIVSPGYWKVVRSERIHQEPRCDSK